MPREVSDYLGREFIAARTTSRSRKRELFPLALRLLGECGWPEIDCPDRCPGRIRFSGRQAQARDRKLHHRFVGRDGLRGA